MTVLDRRHGFAPRKFARALSIVRASAIVHAHQWGGGMWGALLARLTRTPLVAHAHRFDGAHSRRWTIGYRYWIAPTAQRVVCVSEDISVALSAIVGVPAAKLTFVANGVQIGGALSKAAARAELGLPPDVPVIGMVARLRVEKRHDLALEALGPTPQRR